MFRYKPNIDNSKLTKILNTCILLIKAKSNQQNSLEAQSRLFLGGGSDSKDEDFGYYDYHFDPHFDYGYQGVSGNGNHFMDRDTIDYEEQDFSEQLANFSITDFIQGLLNLKRR